MVAPSSVEVEDRLHCNMNIEDLSDSCGSWTATKLEVTCAGVSAAMVFYDMIIMISLQRNRRKIAE